MTLEEPAVLNASQRATLNVSSARSARGNDAGEVRPVTVLVGCGARTALGRLTVRAAAGVPALAETLFVDNSVFEIGMRLVDSGVEDRDRHTRSRVAV